VRAERLRRIGDAEGGGVAWSPDEGDTWNELPDFLDFWAVSFASQHAGWMVGGEGRIVKISF
jgi:photosystem II stability/assembly factor-like uncharacterized protein